LKLDQGASLKRHFYGNQKYRRPAYRIIGSHSSYTV
jgi:hypothetical protein